MIDSLLPPEQMSDIDARYYRDRHVYITGKKDASKELPVHNGVQYSDSRDQLWYNAGYTIGYRDR